MARNSSGGFNKFLNFIGLVDDYQDEYQPSNAGRPSTVVPPRKNRDDGKRRTVNAPSGRGAGQRTASAGSTRRTYGAAANESSRRTYGGTAEPRSSRRAYEEERTNRYAYSDEAENGYYDDGEAGYNAAEEAPRASRRASSSAARPGRHSESARRSSRNDNEPPRRSRFEEPEEPFFDDEPFYDDEPRRSRGGDLATRPIKYTLYSLKEVRSVILDLVRNRLILISFGTDVDPAMHQRMTDTIAGALVALGARMDYVNDYTIMLVPAPMLLPEDREPQD